MGFAFGWSIWILGVENYVEKWELGRDLLWDGVWKSEREVRRGADVMVGEGELCV